MRLLLHTCCGPCAVYPVQFLRDQGHEIVSYFYNPNIHPYKEFVRRRDTLKDFVAKIELDIIIDNRYMLEEFLQAALTATDGRCNMCYETRLQQTAQYAKENGYEGFTTTLLVSPYQNHDVIRAMGEKVAKEEGIAFYYFDFRPGWQQGVEISKELELYRQPYCGCIFSEKDRYYKPGKGVK